MMGIIAAESFPTCGPEETPLVPELAATPPPGQQLRCRRHGTSAAAIAALACAALLVAGWRPRALGQSAPNNAVVLASTLKATGNRTCFMMLHVRLADAPGGTLAELVGDSAVQHPWACMEKCEQDAECQQAIYSSGNSGCYLFGNATAEVAPMDDNDISSAYCGNPDQLAHLQILHKVAMMRGQPMVDMRLQSAWGTAEYKASEDLKKKNLSVKETLAFITGSKEGMGYAGYLKPPEAFEAMPLKMNDGPQGFNTYQDALAGTSTQFPCLLAVAAGFSPENSRRYATAVAEEFVEKGGNVLLGPDVEVMRAPLTGRSYETLSGEDPYLGSVMVRPYIQAVQEKGIIATVKHWLDNNQEIYRMSMDSELDDRTQHEIYLPVFQAAFDAGAAAVMCSYNKVYGIHACENKKLLKKLLREDAGFRGFVVSDWGATHSARGSVDGGLDVEMPDDTYFSKLPELVASGNVSKEDVESMAKHVLAAMYFVGQFDGRFPPEKAGHLMHLPAASKEHRQVALEAIIEGAVLLKNEGNVLPLQKEGKKIAMIGKYCDQPFEHAYAQGSTYSGGGSGFVNTTSTVTPLTAIQDMVKGVTFSDDAAAGEGADVAIVCAAGHSEEGWDRENLSLPEARELVADLRKQKGKKQIVVVAIVPGAVTTRWLTDADAALLLFMPGEQVGPAVAQLLFGEEAPKGRLPVTLPAVGEKRFTGKQYPGECPPPNTWCDKMTANFSEGVLVGHRWNDATGHKPAFPFGFGLTYTTFNYADFAIICLSSGKEALLAFTITNTGARAGVAVPQLYVGFPSLRPALRQLRGFQKVEVPKGESVDVFFTLNEMDWRFYSVDEGKWVSALEKEEEITVYVGSSSADFAWNGTVPCKAEPHVK